MARIYPQELLDVETTFECIRSVVKNWIAGDRNDKEMAVIMNGQCGILNKDIMFLKERYRREAKMLLELTGEEVAT